MKGRVFIDTNILVYIYSEDEPEKKTIAQKLLDKNILFISTQVVQEFSNTLKKKYKVDWKEIQTAIDEITSCSMVFTNQISTITCAISIAEKYKYSFYDSLIIASALETNCKTLYTEDLQHNQIINKKLQILNPFLK